MNNIYESSRVNKGRKVYYCDCCDAPIAAGAPSDVHKFHDENRDYPTARTHLECTSKYLKGELCRECGDWHPEGQTITLPDDNKRYSYLKQAVCLDCATEHEIVAGISSMSEHDILSLQATPVISQAVMDFRPEVYEKHKTMYTSVRFGL